MNQDDLILGILIVLFLATLSGAAWQFFQSHDEREALYGSDSD